MNIKNRFLSHIIVSILTYLSVFLLFVFVQMEANPTLWSIEARVGYVFMALMCGFIVSLTWAYLLNKIDEEKRE